MLINSVCVLLLFKTISSLKTSNKSLITQVDIGNKDNVTVIKGLDHKVKCVPRTFFVQETKFEKGVDCHHEYKRKCHITYTTEYTATSKEKCETKFKKNCYLNYKAVPQREKVRICRTPIEQKCNDDKPGPEVCSMQYENHCETRYKTYKFEQDEPKCKMEQQVRCRNVSVEISHVSDKFTIEELKNRPPHVIQEKCERLPVQKCKLERKIITKIHPETSCSKVEKEICVPNNCETVSGKEICSEEVRAQVHNVQGEECGMEPRENCRNETLLIPRLVPKQNCIRVPKEICVSVKKNPQTIKKPIIKEFCFKTVEVN